MLDAAAIAKTDPGGLGKALASLPEQLENGLRRGLGTHVGVEAPLIQHPFMVVLNRPMQGRPPELRVFQPGWGDSRRVEA